eukprot:TRINITY_DN31509_c0_g1_i2.p1 TRINITY_DN31509_c0_g1~~TRINITY_DN31509_c0_g1_i2.p1  ORF type:complete len:291 (+),score=81.89 TRINITY_DN31509_c0_g1_i2:53-874(+)
MVIQLLCVNDDHLASFPKEFKYDIPSSLEGVIPNTETLIMEGTYGAVQFKSCLCSDPSYACRVYPFLSSNPDDFITHSFHYNETYISGVGGIENKIQFSYMCMKEGTPIGDNDAITQQNFEIPSTPPVSVMSIFGGINVQCRCASNRWCKASIESTDDDTFIEFQGVFSRNYYETHSGFMYCSTLGKTTSDPNSWLKHFPISVINGERTSQEGVELGIFSEDFLKPNFEMEMKCNDANDEVIFTTEGKVPTHLSHKAESGSVIPFAMNTVRNK